MKAKIGLITAFLLLVALAPGLAFYDDFQIYNSVANPYFTSNYTINDTIAGAGELTATIESANNVFLQFYNSVASGDDIAGISLNYSKISANSNFDFNISILSGSAIYDATNFLSIAYFVNNTDSADKNFKSMRGYRVVFTYYNSGNITAILCRNTFDIGEGCGVTLASGSVILENHYGTGTTTLTVNNTILIELNYNPATNLLTVNAGNHTLLTHTDTVYISGGFVITSASLTSRITTLKLDNLSILGISGVPAGSGDYNDPANWNILGWLNNVENLPGYYQSASHNVVSGINCYWSFKDKDVCVKSCELGLMANCDGSNWGGYWGGSPAQIRTACGIYACDVTNITYSLHGSTITETTNSPLGSGYDDFALPAKYYDGITAYFYVIGQPFTESIRASIHILPYMRLKASAPGCSYVSPLKWYAIYAGQNVNLAQYESPIPITDNNDYWGGNYWKHDNSGDYLISITDGFVCNNSNNITVSYDFYNTQTSALLFTKNVTFPIGYVTTANGTGVGSTFSVNYSLPFDCVFNASICAGAGNLPTFNQTCSGAGCGIPTGATTGLLTDFGGLDGLLTPLTVLLSVVLIAGAIVTRDTHSSQIGLIVIMAGCLILSFYNILPWYITVLITIGAGFFILSQVRTGVFGNAQTA